MGDYCVISSLVARVKVNERRPASERQNKRAFFFSRLATYQFEFHIVSHRSLRSMNSTVDWCDLSDRFPGCIGSSGTDRPRLEDTNVDVVMAAFSRTGLFATISAVRRRTMAVG